MLLGFSADHSMESVLSIVSLLLLINKLFIFVDLC